MKDFFNLTTRGKVNRMRPAMWKALEHYAIQPTKLTLLGTDTNIIMRVATASGQPFLLRAAFPGWRTELDNLSEMAWLDALQHTDIGAPKPISTTDGAWVVNETAEGLPGAYRFCLQSWVYGRPLEESLTPENLYKMGELFAKLHNFSTTFVPPNKFTQRKMSHYLSREEEHRLFSTMDRNQYPQVDWTLLDAVNDRVLRAFSDRYAEPAGLRVIHNDLWHGNIHVYHGRLLPFDFEDTLWGYPVQDIAMAMQDLEDDGPRAEYDALLDQFKTGYSILAQWPERYVGEMDCFRAGRILWVANWVARNQPQYFLRHILAISPILKCFLENGFVKYPIP